MKSYGIDNIQSNLDETEKHQENISRKGYSIKQSLFSSEECDIFVKKVRQVYLNQENKFGRDKLQRIHELNIARMPFLDDLEMSKLFLHPYVLKIIKAVFCGNDKGNLDYLKRYAVRNDLGDDIRFLDFVPDTEIAAFYCGALALTMPSYFGPSNLPPLEAFKFKTPVIYPNKSEFQSFLDGACLPIQLDDPKSLCLQIELLLTEHGLRRELVDKGLAKLAKIEKITISAYAM